MADQGDGRFIEEPRDLLDDVPTLRFHSDPSSLLTWFWRHRRVITLCAAIVGVLWLLVRLDFLVPFLSLLPWIWTAFVAVCILVAIAGWLRSPVNRERLRDFLSGYWRELIVVTALGVVAGEVARADDPVAAAVIGGLGLGPFVALPLVALLVEHTRLGPWLHSVGPQWFVAFFVAAYIVSPQFEREMPLPVCEEPAYVQQVAVDATDEGQPIYDYQCFNPETTEYTVPDQEEGRNLFGLWLSSVRLRIYSLNFTDNRFEGIGFCTDETECFP